MANPSFRAAGAYINAVGVSSASVAAPAGTLAGDLLIINAGGLGAARTFSTPVGWTQIDQDNDDMIGGAYQLAVFYQVSLSSSPANTTLSVVGGSMNLSVQMWGYKDVDTVNPLDGSTSGWAAFSAVNPLAMPSITTTVNNSLVIFIIQDSHNETYSTVPTGSTKNVDQDTTQVDKFVEADLTKAVAGTVSGLTFSRTLSGGTPDAKVMTIAVRPVSVATATGLLLPQSVGMGLY